MIFCTCDEVVVVEELVVVVVLSLVVDEAVVAEDVEVVEIGSFLPPIVIDVDGAFPKLKVAEVALELTLTLWVLPAVNVPCHTVLPFEVTDTQALALLFNFTVFVFGAFVIS